MLKKSIIIVISAFITIFISSANASNHAKSLSNLGMNEIMFAQSMIPHHQQALEMSNFALKNSKNNEIRKLANAIIKVQKKEIAQMEYWLKVTKSGMSMDHDMDMMDSDGMLSEQEIKKLSSLKGEAFNLTFLKAMIAHHEGALKMVSLLTGTKNGEARKLANSIKTAQLSEINFMKKLIIKIS